MQAYSKAFAQAGTKASRSVPHTKPGSNFMHKKINIQPKTQALLYLFMLERIGHEILYESAHRPDWITVPLHSLVELLANIKDSIGRYQHE